jgi:hypothetical protein
MIILQAIILSFLVLRFNHRLPDQALQLYYLVSSIRIGAVLLSRKPWLPRAGT